MKYLADTPAKAKVGFGLAYITKRTPDFAKWFFRGVLYAAAVINIILGIVTEIPEDLRLIIGKYSIYAVTAVHSLSKLFGVSVEGPNEKV